jgi:hypothetical protein
LSLYNPTGARTKLNGNLDIGSNTLYIGCGYAGLGFNLKVTNNYVKTILNDKFNLVYEKNSSYQLYRSDYSTPEFMDFTNQKGRFYRFTVDVFSEKLLKR